LQLVYYGIQDLVVVFCLYRLARELVVADNKPSVKKILFVRYSPNQNQNIGKNKNAIK